MNYHQPETGIVMKPIPRANYITRIKIPRMVQLERLHNRDILEIIYDGSLREVEAKYHVPFKVVQEWRTKLAGKR